MEIKEAFKHLKIVVNSGLQQNEKITTLVCFWQTCAEDFIYCSRRNHDMYRSQQKNYRYIYIYIYRHWLTIPSICIKSNVPEPEDNTTILH